MRKDSVKSITPVILVGGLGTRLLSVLEGVPKVLAPVSGRPFLYYLLEKIMDEGFDEAVLCTGYKGNLVKETFGSAVGELKIIYSQEPKPLGTGGALRHAAALIKTGILLVMNGDSYTTSRFSGFIDWFFKKGHSAAILLSRVPDSTRFGLVKVDGDGRVISFTEKHDQPLPGWISSGVYLLKKSLINSMPSGRQYSLEREFFPGLIGGGIYGYRNPEAFIDIGTPESYARAPAFFRALRKTEGS